MMLTREQAQQQAQQFNNYRFQQQPQFSLSFCPPPQQETPISQAMTRAFLIAAAGAAGTAIVDHFMQR